ncbi:hypothetical protein JD974_04550 [Chromobacterium haemolyticum]|uniref:Uncharacterized protein n=1 Tax=Chromobacterium haemolyticum TaxID=394935 RepID=A0ABS3GKK1_9NEIS|nr:hypothetical protein [Chromobacterium haemolyticum]MBK0413671.1 hypothetical protein [Chromobacterium haemolyticum]MBO0414773.1 hypothetical protein [Chromobacterium haemolyticum]MBO0498034.1 hypothetical protein [Chromobacterium haemolyticum]
MINRFRTRCNTCGHNNTLRITLGTEEHQEHTFACAGCGLSSRVALDIDFTKRFPVGGLYRESIPEKMREMFTQPHVQFHLIENCEICDEEGTVTNLDPNFLVRADMLHQEGVFPWMMESIKIGMLKNVFQLPAPHVNDIIVGVGGVRNIRKGIAALVKAYSLDRAGRHDLRAKILEEFCLSVGISDNLSVRHFALVCANQFICNFEEKSVAMLGEVRACIKRNPIEFRRLHKRLVGNFEELLARQVGILDEYAKGYDQFSQTLIYAMRGAKVDDNVVASSMDLRAVKMFYGNCYEQLSAGFDLPACINNINSGRPYDQFESMNLQKYLSINKANRANPFINNTNFSILHDEFDSTLRNASHHGALRVFGSGPEFLEYRCSDSSNWKKIPFAEYLLRCNKIMICMMQLLLLEVAVLESIN